jgi:hypothetical protein
MSFTVVWQRWAEDELAAIWLAASSDERAAITEAANLVDSILRKDPHLAGESRSGDSRIVIISPLAFTFDIRLDDRIVDVFAVHRLPKKQIP